MHKIVGADAYIRPFLQYCNFLQRDDVGIVPYIVVERLYFYLRNFMNNPIKNHVKIEKILDNFLKLWYYIQCYISTFSSVGRATDS